MADAPLQVYFSALQREYKTGAAGEHSYRHALKALLQEFEGNKAIHAINEPSHIECGAPDYVVQRKGMPLGHVEAKDIGINLARVDKSSQLKRYKAALGNLILTDYLQFWWYVDGELRLQVEFAKEAANRKLVLADGGEKNLVDLLGKFLRQKPLKIGRPKALAVRLANIALIIRELIEKSLAQDSTNGERKSSTLHEQLGGFRNVLMATLTETDFADMYAQTIVYGMFAARENHTDPNAPFTRFTAAYDLPKTNPFLRQLFNYIAGPDLDKRLEWAILDLADLLNVVDMGEIRTEFAMHKPGDDPVVHFYETFLAEYDPKKREMRGVYYTPQPVVGYIVRSINELLKSEFGLKAGLADHEKTTMQVRKAGNGELEEREVHRVQILDPACGTGSFLLRVIDEIHATFKGDEGSWPGYVRDHLLPRLHGFELMMAPYTVAHMKIGMRLKNELDVELRDDERLGIYLTNTMDNPYEAPEKDLFVKWLVEEAEAAWEIKSQNPVLVILGNPPYSGHSANASEEIKLVSGKKKKVKTFIGRLIAEYSAQFADLQKPGQAKWLQDDYVKFLRWAQWRIERTGQGIVGMITNHGYLDNPTFKGMRQSLMQTFDKIYVLDLHGNDRKKERVPEEVQKLLGIGPKDENVFDIQQGVAICLLVKLLKNSRSGILPDIKGSAAVPACESKSGQGRPPSENKDKSGGKDAAATPLGQVFHSEIWGDRKRKYAELDNQSAEKTRLKKLKPSLPFNLFIPQDEETWSEYSAFPSIPEIFSPNGDPAPGIVTTHDKFAISWSKDEQISKVEALLGTESEIEARRIFKLCSQNQWNYRRAIDDLQDQQWREKLVEILYRPFDLRWTVYDKNVAVHRRERVMKHIAHKKNLALCSIRSVDLSRGWEHVWASKESWIQLASATNGLMPYST